MKNETDKTGTEIEDLKELIRLMKIVDKQQTDMIETQHQTIVILRKTIDINEQQIKWHNAVHHNIQSDKL